MSSSLPRLAPPGSLVLTLMNGLPTQLPDRSGTLDDCAGVCALAEAAASSADRKKIVRWCIVPRSLHPDAVGRAFTARQISGGRMSNRVLVLLTAALVAL